LVEESVKPDDWHVLPGWEEEKVDRGKGRGVKEEIEGREVEAGEGESHRTLFLVVRQI